ncbi:MAG: 50S ribosomal protein L29 [Dysgonamonadaceae bacterium]|jgi:large subunit ribosomal protein L29|nr:50S ribosomal protein L29 [Dysgonamonadaceae bacterium]
MKIAEIRDLTTCELKERLAVETKDYEQKKINHRVSALDSPAIITHLRREIARMKTELRQREINSKQKSN